MSYSFSVSAPDKASAIEAVERKFAEVVSAQAVHAADREAVLANARRVVGSLADDERKGVAVSMSGYIVAQQNGRVTSVSVSCTASHADRL